MPNLGAMPSPASLGQVHSVEELEARFRQSDLNGGEGGAPSGGRTPGPPNDPFADQQPMAIGGGAAGGGGSIPRLIMPGNDPAIGAIHPPVVTAPPAGGAPPTTPDGGAVRQQELLAFKKLLNQMSENQMNGGGGGPPPHQPGPPVQQHHGHPAHAAHMAAVAAQHQGGQGPPPHQGAAMSALPAMLQMMHMAPMPHPGTDQRHATELLKRPETQTLMMAVARGEVSQHSLWQQLTNPATAQSHREIISAVLGACNGGSRVVSPSLLLNPNSIQPPMPMPIPPPAAPAGAGANLLFHPKQQVRLSPLPNGMPQRIPSPRELHRHSRPVSSQRIRPKWDRQQQQQQQQCPAAPA
uniref:Uncharacterized protein n=1 Tax=Anopheles merus TaxID=30066 RepID=A0A182VNH3_ANOME